MLPRLTYVYTLCCTIPIHMLKWKHTTTKCCKRNFFTQLKAQTHFSFPKKPFSSTFSVIFKLSHVDLTFTSWNPINCSKMYEKGCSVKFNYLKPKTGCKLYKDFKSNESFMCEGTIYYLWREQENSETAKE